MPRPLEGTSAPVSIAVLSACWLLIGVISGLLATRLTVNFLSRDTWLTRPRPFEDGGRFYLRRLRINRWKDSLPEAGQLFGGSSIAHLNDTSPHGLDRFIAETRRAEYVHWANVSAGPAFLLILPLWGGVVMTAFAVGAHAPFICIQRYNRPRLERLLLRRLDDQAV